MRGGRLVLPPGAHVNGGRLVLPPGQPQSSVAGEVW